MAEGVKSSALAHMRLYYPRKNGTTEYDDYCQLEASTGKRHPLFDEAEPPEEAIFLWHLYFGSLRESGVSYSELVSYQQTTGIKLNRWEIDLIFLLHSTVEGFINNKQKEAMNNTSK